MDKKVGRNDPCPCGSGKKYKKCCMEKAKQPKKIQAKIIKSGPQVPFPHSKDLMNRTFGDVAEEKKESSEENLES